MSEDMEGVKSCCAAAYGSDVVGLLLGDSYHPGGARLTRRLADLLYLAPGARVLDVAAGRGGTALLLAGEYDARIDGVDLSDVNVTLAQGAADAAGRSDRVRFSPGDAERLPVPDAAYDAAVCECAFCTFPDKTTAAAELARVIRPGGRVGLTDVTAQPDRLPAELTGLAAWIACIADARPLQGYADILHGAGLRITHTEQHDQAMTGMIDQIEARLGVVAMTARDRAEGLGLNPDQAAPMLSAARTAVADRALGYALLVAEKPG